MSVDGRCFRGLVVGVVVCVVAGLWVGVAGASQVGWWHLSSGSRPTFLHGGVGRQEVQEVRVDATEGIYVLERPETFGETGTFAIMEPGASAELMQQELESPLLYGPGNVEVSGGPGDAGGTKPYVIKFVGQLAGRPLQLIGAKAFFLEGGGKTVSSREVSRGAADGVVVLSAANVGEVSIAGGVSPVRLVDRLPVGLEAVAVEAVTWEGEHELECVLATVTCTFAGSLAPFELVEMRVAVKVAEGFVSGAVNEGVVSGGEVPEASIARPLQAGAATPAGVENYEVAFESAGGGLDTQAGSHPFQMTTTVALNETADGEPAGLPKDLAFQLPAGFIGNPSPFTQCTLQQFLTVAKVGEKLGVNNECPTSSAVGVTEVTVHEPTILGIRTLLAPVFNIEPSVGEPLRLGFLIPGTPVFVDASIRTGGDYGVTVHARNLSQVAGLLRSEFTVFGVPGAVAHSHTLGPGCLEEDRGKVNHLPCNALEDASPPAFLSMPTSCNGPMQTSMEMATWDHPDVFTSRAGNPMPELDGCNRLAFEPSITVTPDDQHGSSPTGLTVGVHVPQEQSLTANGLSEAEVKDTTVALPAGVVLNPAAAGGLSACLLEQIGLESPAAASCPESSKVATVEINTPALPNPLKGGAYVAAQNANPFGSLFAIYVFAEDPISGVRIKLAGNVQPDPATGQLTTTFSNTPQAPFEDFKIHFFGGARGPLATPGLCGNYETKASFTPWSGNPAVPAASTFAITSGPNGAACASPLPFQPTVAAGSTNLQAGGLTAFTTTLSRADGQQNIGSVQLHTPPGFSGFLTKVSLCGEAQANTGTCPASSLIGETTVSVGLGGSPYTVTGGKVYITGPYKGAPFGLSIVNPAKAGPFDLGSGACDCVIVRASMAVDRHTSQLTITTDSEGPYEIPSILQGIPLQIQHVNVTVNKAGGFTFNPTSCDPQQITATLTSTQQAKAAVNVPFQVTNCAALKFTPKFTFTTNGHTSKRNGASLTTTVTYPKTSPGTEANLAKVKVELPKALPSRLTTLQKACLAATFEQNPANCPPGSIIGHATVKTPLVPVPLTGPAYFVSHGGAKFPDLTIILQGYGITIELTGQTFISKQGITSTTFNTIPDQPFTQFQLTLPQGPNSALAANNNLCKTKPTITTTTTAQNNTQTHQTNTIHTTNCHKHHTPKHKHTHNKKHG